MADEFLTTIYRRGRLRQALAKMPDQYQQLAVVLYLMGYHQYEIAAGLEVTQQRVGQIITEFKKRNGLYYATIND